MTEHERWQRYVALSDAINDYAAACGGDTGRGTVGDARINAVVALNRALEQYTGFAVPSCPTAPEPEQP